MGCSDSQSANNGSLEKHQETLCIFASCYHGTAYAYVLRRFYRFYGKSRKNLEWFPCKGDAKSTARTKSFRLGGLTFEKINPEVLFYRTSGRDFMLLGVLPDSNNYKYNFLSTWATKSCPGFCHVEEFTYLSVAKINKQNSDMTWQKYKLNLRNSLLLEEYFQ